MVTSIAHKFSKNQEKKAQEEKLYAVAVLWNLQEKKWKTKIANKERSASKRGRENLGTAVCRREIQAQKGIDKSR